MVGHQPSILRANRSGGGVGTSPGINPIVPYTTAALDYRSSWIAGEMVAMTKATTHNQNGLNLNVPKNLRTLYSIGEDTVGKAPDNKMAVTAFLGQRFSLGDLVGADALWS